MTNPDALAESAELERQRREAAGLPEENPAERAERELRESQGSADQPSPGQVVREADGEAAVIPPGTEPLRQGETPEQRADRLRAQVADVEAREKRRLGQSVEPQQGADPRTGQAVGAPPPMPADVTAPSIRTGAPPPMPEDEYNARVQAQQDAQQRREADGAPTPSDARADENQEATAAIA